VTGKAGEQRREQVSLTDVVQQAFPASMNPAVAQVAEVLNDQHPRRWREVFVDGELLRIPDRIYESAPPMELIATYEADARLMAHCALTRHHDGYVRQAHLQQIIDVDRSWVAPYVLALLGEYVLEIVHDVHAGLREVAAPGSWQRARYVRCARENPGFMELNRQRAMSYWDCYHRGRYRTFADYPAAQTLEMLQEVSSESG
jgi:hypothetical protein